MLNIKSKQNMLMIKCSVYDKEIILFWIIILPTLYLYWIKLVNPVAKEISCLFEIDVYE